MHYANILLYYTYILGVKQQYVLKKIKEICKDKDETELSKKKEWKLFPLKPDLPCLFDQFFKANQVHQKIYFPNNHNSTDILLFSFLQDLKMNAKII